MPMSSVEPEASKVHFPCGQLEVKLATGAWSTGVGGGGGGRGAVVVSVGGGGTVVVSGGGAALPVRIEYRSRFAVPEGTPVSTFPVAPPEVAEAAWAGVAVGFAGR